MFNKTMSVVARVGLNRVVRVAVAIAVPVYGFAGRAQAQYTIVSSDTSGNITFTPGGLVQPIITGVISCITASAALLLIWVGVKWLYRIIKGSK